MYFDHLHSQPGPTDGIRADRELVRAIEAYRRDREALQTLARDPGIDLFARIPHGTGQTYLRELLLAADHTSYHLGQMVAVRRALGIWD